jgi:hypothetical protein
MSSCYKDTLLPFQVGGVCAGHGICVNSTITPDLLLCKCNPFYNGASDFFDSRVELLSNGEYLSLSCNNSVIAIYIIWGFWLVVGIIRVVVLIPIWINFYKRHYTNPELYTKFIFYDVPFRIITMDLFVFTTIYFITGICKIMGMVFGTDIVATIFLTLTLAAYLIVCFDMSKMEFDIFLQSTTSFEEANKARTLRTVIKSVATVLSIAASLILAIVTLTLDKSKGPIVNGEEYALYVRNANGVFFALVEVFTSWMILKRMLMIRLVNANVKANVNSNTNTSISFLVMKMKNEIRSYIVRAILLTILYGCFNISYALPYQTYSIVVVGCLGFAVPHSRALIANKGKSDKNQNRKSSDAKVSNLRISCSMKRTNSIALNSKELSEAQPSIQRADSGFLTLETAEHRPSLQRADSKFLTLEIRETRPSITKEIRPNIQRTDSKFLTLENRPSIQRVDSTTFKPRTSFDKRKSDLVLQPKHTEEIKNNSTLDKVEHNDILIVIE